MTPRPVIAFLLDNLGVGGTELNAVRTARLLVERELPVIALAVRDQGPLREAYEAAGIPVHGIPLRSFASTSVIAARRRLQALIRDYGANIIHSHDFYSNVLAALAAPSTCKVIMSRRWWHSPSRARRLLGRFAYSRADQVLANSPSVGRLLAEEEGVPSSRITVIPNFVDAASFCDDPASGPTALRESFGIGRDAVVLGVVARLSSEKGHDVLLRAYALARRSIPGESHLILIGDGPESGRLQDLSQSLGLEGHVHFAGHRTPPPNLHLNLDVSILPSFSEGFPNSVIEAMAASRPVIASCVGGVPDAVQDGVTGILVPPRDVEALANAITELCASRDRRHDLGRAAFQLARSNYSAKPTIDNLVELYTSLLR